MQQVDERDSKTEFRASNFRVIVATEGSWAAYNIDDATLSQAREWAERHTGDAGYALAVRQERSDSGVDLIWLTRTPEELFD